MRFVSLFSGIGGMDLGLERAGWKCVAQVENNEFCQNVLSKHWPNIKKFGDITKLSAAELPDADAFVGGFPCQDISSARTRNKRKGLHGPASSLWTEFRRLLRERRPRWVLVENSPRWQSWVPNVRSDLSRLGYASLPVVLSAGAVGAPHSRPRCFVVANADSDSKLLLSFNEEVAGYATLATEVSRPDSPIHIRDSDGLPGRMDRLKAIGNAVVPQVAEVIGAAIMSLSREN